MGQFGVSDKQEANKNSVTTTSSSSVVKKVQTLEAFPSKKNNMMMMMLLHHNHNLNRSLSQPFDNDNHDSCVAVPASASASGGGGCGDGDGDGPTHTSSISNLTNHVNLVNSGAYSGLGATSATTTAIDAAAAAAGVSAPVRPLQQPFDYYTSGTTYPAFKSSDVMAASSLGYPFTSAQWKELQRQAMIYKYMMASVPVPHDLLIPTASRSTLNGGGGFNLRLSSNDPEPGRCRRTDGKKWRCSRDVAPNHKYCERHMHRGRPRSRKPVEVHTNNNNNNNQNQNQNQIKRARHDCDPFPTSADVNVAISNHTTRKDGSSLQFVASATNQPYLDSSSLSLHNFRVKAQNFGSIASVSSNKEPRGLEWMLNGDPISLGASDSEFQCLMHNKVGLTTACSCNNSEPQYLNSFALYNSGVLNQQNRRPWMFLNPLDFPMENLQSQKPRGFIDAWSNTGTEQRNANNTDNKSNVASIGKLSLSSLELSMGGGTCVHEDIGTVDMGLGLMENGNNTQQNDTKTNLSNWLTPSSSPWVASTTPGGPLAEVLRPSTVVTTANNATTASNPSSPVITQAETSSSPLGTLVSSPSGVLQKTLASFSDSSSNSSPGGVASSRANNSDVALLRFNHK